MQTLDVIPNTLNDISVTFGSTTATVVSFSRHKSKPRAQVQVVVPRFTTAGAVPVTITLADDATVSASFDWIFAPLPTKQPEVMFTAPKMGLSGSSIVEVCVRNLVQINDASEVVVAFAESVATVRSFTSSFSATCVKVTAPSGLSTGTQVHHIYYINDMFIVTGTSCLLAGLTTRLSGNIQTLMLTLLISKL